MKALYRIIVLLVMHWIVTTHCLAAEPNFSPVEQLDFSQIEHFIREIDKEVTEHLPQISLREMFEKANKGEFDWNIGQILKSLTKFFFKEVTAHSGLLSKLIILAVLCAMLSNLQSAFDKGNIAILGHGIAYLVLITIALSSFTMAVNTGKQAIDNMTGFLYAIMPVLLTLMAAMGGVTSAALIHPTMVFILSVTTSMIKLLIFPLIYFTAVLSIISHISPQFKVNKLASLFKDISLTLLGIIITIFVGFLGMQGLAGAVSDGLTIKAAKFAAGSFIPVVGKMMADALDTVIGTSLILKNAVGFVGVIAILLVCAIPAVKIIAMVLIYRIAAAVIQPFGDDQLAEALHGLANSLLMVFGTVAAVGLMFFFILFIAVGTGNITMMYR